MTDYAAEEGNYSSPDTSNSNQISDAELAVLFGGSDTGTASSGTNGSGSSNWLASLGDLVKTGTTAYSNVTRPGAPASTANSQARAANAPINWQKYLPWIGGAVVLLIVVGLIFRRK